MQHTYKPKTQKPAFRIIKGGKLVKELPYYEKKNNRLLKAVLIVVVVEFVLVITVLVRAMMF